MDTVEREADFSAYVNARQRSLARFAYLLTGGAHEAEDLVQSVLAKVYARWDRIRDVEAPDAYVRRMMVNEYNSWWRRQWRRREHTNSELIRVMDPPASPDVQRDDELWAIVRSLAPQQRAAVVLRQATGVDVATDLAPRAIARRRRDQGNRLVLAACACVAAVAIAVPTVWAVGRPDLVPGPALPTGSTSPATSPDPRSTPSKSTTPTPPRTTTSGQSAPSTPSTSSTSVSPAVPAGLAYAVDNVLHLGPATVALPGGATVDQFARLQAGAVVVSWHGSGPTSTQVLDVNGRALINLGDTHQWVVSRDRSRVATSNGRTVTVLDHAAKVLATRSTASRPIDIVGNEVYLASDNGSQEWDLATGATRTLPKGLVAVSPSQDRAAITYRVSPDSLDSCWAVVDLTSSRSTRLVEKCGSPYLPSAFSANGTYLVGENVSDGGFFSSFGIVRADTGKAVFGGGPSSDDEGAGWGVRLGADERTVWLSANTSTPRFPAEANSVEQCTIGAGCSGVTPSLKTPRSQPRYVVESPTSD